MIRSSDGVQLGYQDMDAHTLHPESPELSAELEAAVGYWRRPSAEPSQSTKPPARPKDPAAFTASRPPGRAVGAVPSKPTPVLDLIHNTPGVSLQAQIDAAHAVGQRATILRSILLGKHARSPWERGAIGERLVAAELERLRKADPRWRFLHSIPVGTKDSDIDHLLIGPAGVFTINSKNHAGMKVWVGGNTFMVNGVRQPYIRNSRHEASRAAKLLGKAAGFAVAVRGMVVPVNADTFVVKAAPEDVTVINRSRLVRHLRRLPERLPQHTVEKVFELARRSTTWLG
ncbi:nuclease-related domain-containing protein [Tessaracoccus sp. ZS01]|uniref:nuclease-related domain-containing protein n=1 Tax=Tessaracoccus sp. ZS01 TaxID=1906324 RepID=UPI0013017A8C|nr:nuclease-related domain-containing protein [Tessaracoccus sp. ZS01]